MEFKGSNLIKLLLLTQCLIVLCASENFDFFYFVQNWPGSFCNTRMRRCCYPPNLKPDFGIHGIWPNRKDGSYPRNCDPSRPLSQTQIQPLVRRLQNNWPSLPCPSNNGFQFWSHEWAKHGTCAKSILNETTYFELALRLKESTKLKQTLSNAGINPNGKSYKLNKIEEVLKKAYGVTPYIQCNSDKSGNNQLFQTYICVNSSSPKFNIIECPVFPKPTCKTDIVFPIFNISATH